MQWKRCFACSLFFSAVLAAGCSEPAPPAPPPYQRVRLVVACPDDRAESIVREYARTWAVHQEADLATVPYKDATGPGEFSADIWLVAPSQLPRYAAAQLLRPLPGYFRERASYDWVDLLPQYREQLLVWNRELYGVPIVGEAPVCFYRSDLFAEPANQADFKKKHGRPLGPPTTWEEVANVAEFFAARGGPSLPALPVNDDDLDRLFYTLASSYGQVATTGNEADASAQRDEAFSFHYDLKIGRVRIAEPAFSHTLRLLKRLQACRPAGTAQTPAEQFAAGKAVFCFGEAGALSTFQKSAAVAGRFALSAIPGTACYFDFATGSRKDVATSNYVPYLGAGGLLAVVPHTSAHFDAAFDLLAYLSGPEISRQIVIEPRWGGGATRRDHLKGANARWDSFQLDRAGTQALKDALERTLMHTRVRNPVFKLRTPDALARQDTLLAQVRAALAGKIEPTAALSEAAKRWQELDRAQGPGAALANYRLSVGLRAN